MDVKLKCYTNMAKANTTYVVRCNVI